MLFTDFFFKDSTNFKHRKMPLKIRILRCLRRLFLILVSLTVTLFSEKILNSTRCIIYLVLTYVVSSPTRTKNLWQYLACNSQERRRGASGTGRASWQMAHLPTSPHLHTYLPSTCPGIRRPVCLPTFSCKRPTAIYTDCHTAQWTWNSLATFQANMRLNVFWRSLLKIDDVRFNFV
jgi:hypothetical protein